MLTGMLSLHKRLQHLWENIKKVSIHPNLNLQNTIDGQILEIEFLYVGLLNRWNLFVTFDDVFNLMYEKFKKIHNELQNNMDMYLKIQTQNMELCKLNLMLSITTPTQT